MGDYILDTTADMPVDGKSYKTQAEAMSAAKAQGHKPLVSRVRHIDKGKPDQWLEA